MRVHSLAWIASLLVAIAIPSIAQADFVNYQIGTGSSVVVANNTDPGLVVTAILDSVANKTFGLDDGQSTTFDFFRIWTDESAINRDDWLYPKTVTATLDFAVPPEDAILHGTSVGFTAVFLQGGLLTWNGPVIVTAGDRVFEVKLSDVAFNVGWFGVNEGQCYGADVKATVTQISGHRQDGAVPAPAAPLLVVVGLGLVGWLKRRIA